MAQVTLQIHTPRVLAQPLSVNKWDITSLLQLLVYGKTRTNQRIVTVIQLLWESKEIHTGILVATRVSRCWRVGVQPYLFSIARELLYIGVTYLCLCYLHRVQLLQLFQPFRKLWPTQTYIIIEFVEYKVDLKMSMSVFTFRNDESHILLFGNAKLASKN